MSKFSGGMVFRQPADPLNTREEHERIASTLPRSGMSVAFFHAKSDLPPIALT